MHKTNYVRDLTKEMTIEIHSVDMPDDILKERRLLLSLMRQSVKFILPPRGVLIEDNFYSAIDADDRLRLPYPVTALEFSYPVTVSDSSPSKYIVLASELNETIRVDVVGYIATLDNWVVPPPCYLPLNGYIRRDVLSKDGAMVNAHFRESIGIDVYKDGINALLCFINAMQCTNVHAVNIGSSAKDAAKNKLLPLPFDDYHVLTIETHRSANDIVNGRGLTGRSPREHIRRGHIRRLQDGRKIWVNSAIINAGIGSKVSKIYRVK